MKDIQLDELPKSKEFMKHVKIADGLSKETGLEHGFIFCKPNDEIVVDKMCVGNECAISVSPTVCDKFDSRFHTHPKDKAAISRLSVGDIHNSAYSSFISKKPHITCAKSTTNNNIVCNKCKVINKKTVQLAQAYKKELKTDPKYKIQESSLNILNKVIKPEIIKFDSKTGKIIKNKM